MAEMLNTITASGASWSGAAPVANGVFAQGAVWSGAGTTATAAGILGLDGAAAGAVPVVATASGQMAVTGSGRATEGVLTHSARRTSDPAGSRNGGHLVPRH